MKYYRIIALAISIVSLLLAVSIAQSNHLGLLVIAHGSPSQRWNASALELMDQIKHVLNEQRKNPFSAVRVAFMEFAQPSINSAIRDFEREDIQTVYALPVFIAPSEHTLFDLPAILGLYDDTRTAQRLKKEGAAIVRTKMHITLGPTLGESDVLNEVMLDRVKELSISPDSESVVILAHGDNKFEPIWRGILQRVGLYISAKTGIRHVDFAFVEMGQSFVTDGVPVILSAAEKNRRTIVVGLYLSSGVGNMAKNVPPGAGAMKNIVFASRGLLPDQRIAKWIVDTAMEWHQRWEE